jgi:hypothetical protein
MDENDSSTTTSTPLPHQYRTSLVSSWHSVLVKEAGAKGIACREKEDKRKERLRALLAIGLSCPFAECLGPCHYFRRYF